MKLRRLWFPVLLGVIGCTVLVSLGIWQVQRLQWKEAVLTDVDVKLTAVPVALPKEPLEARDEYLPVRVAGAVSGEELHVLSSGTFAGTGYRVISAFVTDDGRRVMLDQGVMPLDQKNAVPQQSQVIVEGNLLWPDDNIETSPEPDFDRNIWFARDVEAMAQSLKTEAVLIVLQSGQQFDARVEPVPVDSSGIKNDHREYAITWFGLAIVWAAMTGYFIYREAKRRD